jgi:putative tryptophan/tyrosine transport system substrate-binding protein
MRRREFVGLVGGAAAWPLAARAQQRGLPVVGFVNVGARSDADLVVSGFRRGLGEGGLVESRNVAIEYRCADNQIDRVPELVAELVKRRVAVIVAAPNSNAIVPAKAATSTIPIVFMSGPDPVALGLVASLNRPGSNLTGVTLLSPQLTTKRLGLLHDLAPQVRTVAVLLPGLPGQLSTTQTSALNEAEAAGRSVGLRIFAVYASNENEFDSAFATAIREGAGALVVSTTPFFINSRYRLVALAAKHNLPTVYQDRVFAAAGGLMSYGASLSDAYRQIGLYTARVLKGEKPADLPVLLPTKFEFIINLQTAKALGIEIPAKILALADEVIE